MALEVREQYVLTKEGHVRYADSKTLVHHWVNEKTWRRIWKQDVCCLELEAHDLSLTRICLDERGRCKHGITGCSGVLPKYMWKSIDFNWKEKWEFESESRTYKLVGIVPMKDYLSSFKSMLGL